MPSAASGPSGETRSSVVTEPGQALGLVGACALLVTLATWNSAHKSIWLDEAFSLYTALRPLSATIQRAIHFELQPPLYFAVLNLWLRLSGSIAFARALSTACTVGLLLVLYSIARTLRIRPALALPALAAATPGIVWAATEARVYAMALLFSAMTLYFFIRLVVTGTEQPRRAMIGYLVFGYLAVMTQYYCGLLLAGHWAASVAIRCGWRRMSILAALFGLALLPWVPIVASQRTQHYVNRSDAASVGLAGRTILSAFLTDAGALHRAGAPAIVCLVLLGLVAARVASARRTRAPLWTSEETAMAVAAGVPAVGLFVMKAMNLALVEPRHAAVVVPAGLTAVALLVSRMPGAAWRYVSGVAVFAITAIALVSYERNDVARSSWRDIASFLSTHGTAAQPILVFSPREELPFTYTYHGPAAVYGLPVENRLDNPNPPGMAIQDERQLDQRIASLDRGQGVWIVANRLPTITAFGLERLQKYLQTRARIASDTTFPFATVVHVVGTR